MDVKYLKYMPTHELEDLRIDLDLAIAQTERISRSLSKFDDASMQSILGHALSKLMLYRREVREVQERDRRDKRKQRTDGPEYNLEGCY